ncbi:MAG: DUF4390 domain-containing protein [Candidatus Methylomirabilia bacterium]
MRLLGILGPSWRAWLLLPALALWPGAAGANIRISNLAIFLNDQDLVVEAVLLQAIPASFHESLKSGVPVQARFFVELWQYNRFWPDRRVTARTVERRLTYNVLTKEYTVVFMAEEVREPYLTKELWEAQRILSDLRGLKLVSASELDPQQLFYVLVRAEVSVRGPSTLVSRFLGEAEETDWVRSSYLTIMRRR